MKIISKANMERIRERLQRFKSAKIVIDANKHDKDLTIKSLVEDLEYVYTKLGLI